MWISLNETNKSRIVQYRNIEELVSNFLMV